MQFKDFAVYLRKLEKTPLRNKMTEILADLFKNCRGGEISEVCYLSLGRLAPKYEGIEFNMGEKLVIRALAISRGKTIAEVTEIYKETGDLGQTTLELKPAEIKGNLSVAEVYKELREIAEEAGIGSVERKIKRLAGLLAHLDPLGAKYVSRIPVNKLRLGFSDMTILDALSWMRAGNKSLRPKLERAFNVLADIGKIADIFKTKGLKGIDKIKGEAGVPIRAALAERLRLPEEILKKMGGKCALEPKYDGFRVQISIDKSKDCQEADKGRGKNLTIFKENKLGLVRIFSRNLDNITYMFPDIIKAVRELKVKSAILDGEAIAYDPKSGKFLNFQETVQRKRKHGVREKAKEIPLKVFVFDLLYLNGRSLLGKPFKERRNFLEGILGKNKTILLTRQRIVSKASEFKQFFQEVVGEGLEGLMAKKLDAVYQAGARNFNWIKYKAGMKSELADTIDCVVMGYYFGRGKRSTFGIGAFLVGVVLPLETKLGPSLNLLPKQERLKIKALKLKKEYLFLTVSKIGTGLTDSQWKKMFKRLKELKTPVKPEEYVVTKNLYPDVWCQPRLVVEIEADTITRSPLHTAGLALRFPRLKKFREDKKITQATSLIEINRLHLKT